MIFTNLISMCDDLYPLTSDLCGLQGELTTKHYGNQSSQVCESLLLGLIFIHSSKDHVHVHTCTCTTCTVYRVYIVYVHLSPPPGETYLPELAVL